MRKRMVLGLSIGGIFALLHEFLWMWQKATFVTHGRSAIVSRLLTAFFEGAFLFLILTWRDRLRFRRQPWKGYMVFFAFLVMYYYVRGITVTFSLFMSTLPSAFLGALIEKLIGTEVSSSVLVTAFTVLIDVALLLLIFYPLLTLGNKWVEKGQETEKGR